jgi:6-phosphogluconolactonase (cycloisomerase 2 family)
VKLALLVLAACGRVDFDPFPHTFAYVIDGYGAGTTKTSLRILEVAADGSLTEAASSPFELGAEPENLRGNAGGTRLFVVSDETQSLYTLSIDPVSGALALLDQQIVGTAPEMIALHPNGRWLYVADWSSASRIDGFALDADGVPSAMIGSPFSFPGTYADWVEVAPSGNWAYIIDQSAHAVIRMAIASDTSALSALGGPAWPANDLSPYAALIEHTGRFGFIAPDMMGGVPGFTIDSATGALSTTPGTRFGETSANTCMNAAMDRGRGRLFLADNGGGANALDAYRVDEATGGLVELAGSPFPTAGSIWSVASSPVGDDVYTTSAEVGPAIIHFRADDTQVVKIGEYDFPNLDQADRLTLVATP